MAEEKLTVMNDLGEIKTIDFVNKFSTNISELLKLLGVTRKEPLSADMKIRTYKWTTDIDHHSQGCLGGTAVKHLPSAQGMIPGFCDQAPHWIPCPAGSLASSSPTPPACVPSLAGCLYLCRINK